MLVWVGVLLWPEGMASAQLPAPNMRGIQVLPNGLFGRQEEDGEAVRAIPNVSITENSGSLEKIATALEPYLKSELEDGNLQFMLPQDYQNARQMQTQICQILRNYGSSSSNGGNGYYVGFATMGLNGSMTSYGQHTVLLQETDAPQRTLFVCQDDDRSRLVLSQPTGYFLSLTLGPGQSIHVVESDGDRFYNKQFRDFGQMQLTDSEYYEQRLYPVMKRFGISAPVDAYSESARQLVGQYFQFPEEKLQAFLAAYGDALTAADYIERKESHEELQKDYQEHREAMVRVVLDNTQPAELRAQLVEIMAAKEPKLNTQISQSLIPANTVSDPAFLAWMLREEEQQETVNTSLVAILRQSLAEKTGDPEDTPALDWIQSQFGSIEVKTFENELDLKQIPMMDLEGVILEPGLSQLISFQLNESGQLVMDREHWRRPFGDLTLQEHVDEVKKELEARNLPDNWLVPRVGNLQQDMYPLVLFQRMRLEAPVDDNQTRHIHGMRNSRRRVGSSNQNVSQLTSNEHYLELDMGNGPVKIDESPFLLKWEDFNDHQLCIYQKPGEFCLTVQGLNQNEFLKVLSRGNTFVFQCMQGQTNTNLQCSSYQEFCEEYPQLQRVLLETFHDQLKLELPTPGSDAQPAIDPQDSTEN